MVKAFWRGLWRHPSRPLFLAYWLALATGTHWPRLTLPGVHSDKLLHGGAFAGLTLLLGWAYPKRWGSPHGRLGILGLLLMAYATLDEVTQMHVPGRTASMADWGADLLGIGGGLLLIRLLELAAHSPLLRGALRGGSLRNRFATWSTRATGTPDISSSSL